MKKLIFFSISFLAVFAHAAPQDHGVDYDIIYVNYPLVSGPNDIPQGEHAYRIIGGADLMRLSPDGSTETIIDCDNTCSVMDPYVSYDGTTVYYSKIIDIPSSPPSGISLSSAEIQTAGYIFKVNVSGNAPYTEVQLTFPGSYDYAKYAGNTQADDDPAYNVPYSGARLIRDMAPVPLSDGRLLFTSNRASTISFETGTSYFDRSVQHMYTIDDHDGTKNTPELSNMQRIEKSGMSMIQHPIQLKDGRLLFSTWQDFGHKFSYAMTELFTMHPDGSNLQQFTEPHDKNKNVNHFITQLSNTDIVVDWYYPSFDFGFGALVRYDIAPHNGDFLENSFSQQKVKSNTTNWSYRKFDRPNSDNVWVITPHSENADVPSRSGLDVAYGADREGKYAYPSWAKGGNMLVSYSLGYVNVFDSACYVICNDSLVSNPPACSGFSNGHRFGTEALYPNGSRCETLKSGIYLIKNAETGTVTDPTDTAQLAVMIDDVNFNEIWPRALVPYNDVFGQSTPDVLPSTRFQNSSKYVAKGEAAAIIGTSSMLNRETSHDHRFQNSRQRELHGGEWTKFGTEVGLFNDSDVFGVRILATPEIPFTSTIATGTSNTGVGQYQSDYRLNRDPRRFSSAHSESWEILGEFPLTNKNTTDGQGNPDTSWWAKIPSDTPTTIQAIDSNGMTLYSETVWRSLAPGEERTDCGGCHAHSTNTTPLDFSTTQAGQGADITAAGLPLNDDLIVNKFWDLSGDRIPVLSSDGGVEVKTGGSWDIEYNRDVKPIFQSKCNSCHTSGGSGAALILDDGEEWVRLVKSGGYDYTAPQMSKWIRSPQARMSQLVWVAWGERLDGRTNGTRNDDVDYPDAHPALSLTFEEKRTIARWVDLGLPVNYPDVSTDGFGYEDDNQLPSMTIYTPKKATSPINQKIRIGVADAQSGINWATFVLEYYDVSTPQTVIPIATYNRDERGVVTANMPSLTVGQTYVVKATVDDNAGNTEIVTSMFTVQAAIVTPAAPQNLTVSTP